MLKIDNQKNEGKWEELEDWIAFRGTEGEKDFSGCLKTNYSKRDVFSSNNLDILDQHI